MSRLFRSGSALATMALWFAGVSTRATAQNLVLCDSVRMAAMRGDALASRHGTGGWAVAGFLLPPAIAAAGALSVASWEKARDPVPAIGSGLLITLTLSATRHNARTVRDPSSMEISGALGSAGPAVTAAFVDAYRRRARLERRKSLNRGLWVGVPLIVGTGVLVAVFAPAFAST